MNQGVSSSPNLELHHNFRSVTPNIYATLSCNIICHSCLQIVFKAHYYVGCNLNTVYMTWHDYFIFALLKAFFHRKCCNYDFRIIRLNEMNGLWWMFWVKIIFAWYVCLADDLVNTMYLRKLMMSEVFYSTVKRRFKFYPQWLAVMRSLILSCFISSSTFHHWLSVLS